MIGIPLLRAYMTLLYPTMSSKGFDLGFDSADRSGTGPNLIMF